MFWQTEIKYQLVRNKNKSVLMVCVAALLAGCMAFYLGNIQSNRTALKNLAENVPVKVWVTGRNGANRSNISIDEAHFEALMNTGVHDALYTSSAAGALEESARLSEPFLGGDTRVTGTNDIRAVPGLSEETLSFAQGWDGSFLSGAEPVCAVHEKYAAAHNLKIGDEITLPLYGIRYASLGVAYEAIGDVSLKVIGTYRDPVEGGRYPPDMCVPVAWLKDASEKNGVVFFYDSFHAVLDDPLNLNSFKENLPKIGFMEIFKDAQNTITGDAISVEDELFIKTAGELQKNLAVFRSFLIPFFGLIIGLVTLVTFLVLRSSRRDMAIAASLGQSKFHIGLVHFLGILLMDFIGCVIALPVMYFVAGIAAGQIVVVLGLFLLCACVGTAAALMCLLRFDTLALLTKID